MLPKKKRINKELFNKIMKNGRYINTISFSFCYIANPTPQYSFVVPKAVAKRANVRNNLRRNGYNILNKHNLKNLAGIFFYKKGSNTTEKGILKGEIQEILNKIKVYG